MIQVKQIGRYQIREEIGRGSMASVYRAYDPKHNLDVALKVLHPHLVEKNNILQRFKQEAKAAAQLQHAHIIPVYEFGHDGPHYYMTMHYVRGGTLSTLLTRRGALPASEAVSLLSKIADALHQAHQIPLVHRDIKPANILIDQWGNPFLSDFGIARVQDNNLTQEESTLGTPNYMSPEQVKGEVVTEASDIYGLGVVLFQAVTGELPFTAKHAQGVMYKHVYELPPRPRSINPAIAPRLEEIILISLEKNPQNRFSTMQQMAEAMQTSLMKNGVLSEESAKIMPTSQVEQAEQAESAKRGLALLIVILLFVLGIGGGFFYGTLHKGGENGVVVVAPTAQPTLTQEPTHTTLPGMPTNTPPPTFTPPPTPELVVDPDLVRTAGTSTPVEFFPTAAPNATEVIAQAPPTTVSQAPPAPTQATSGGVRTQAPAATQALAPTQALVPTQAPAPTQPLLTTQAPIATQALLATQVTEVATAILVPTQTATATATPEPTQTATATATPEPTQTATATATAEPTQTATATATTVPTSIPTATVIPPTVTPTATAIPATVTPIPSTPTPTFAGYNRAPRLVSPSGGERLKNENITFEWLWNDPPLQATDQFVIMGFRDGQTMQLARVDGSQRRININMPDFGHFETDWRWYIRIEDESGIMWPNTQSVEQSFGISLSK